MYYALSTHPKWGTVEIIAPPGKDPKFKAKKVGPYRMAKALRKLSKQMRASGNEAPNDTVVFNSGMTVKVREGKEKYFQRKWWIGRAWSQAKEWCRFVWKKTFGGFTVNPMKHPMAKKVKLTPLTVEECTRVINNRPNGRTGRDKVNQTNNVNWWKRLSTKHDIKNPDNDGVVFEHAVARLYLNRGYKVLHSPIGGDYGIDLILIKGKKQIGVQCKDYAKKETRRVDLQLLMGAMQTYGITEGMYTNIAGFDKNAKKFAKHINVKLLDVNDLAKMGTQ